MTQPNEPEVIRVMNRWRARLLTLDTAAAADIVNLYAPILLKHQEEILSLVKLAQTQDLTPSQLRRLARFRALEAQIARDFEAFSRVATGRITQAQIDAIGISQTSTRAIVDAALPRGINSNLLARVGIQWNVVPSDAFATFVGFSGDGAPLIQLLDTIGPGVADGVRHSIGSGIISGQNPVVVARAIERQFGIGLERSLAISRTEMLRSYRESTRLQYAANSNIVKGYRRLSAKDGRVCMACLALDGTFYRLDQPLNEHVSGRCALIPETVTYRDLGLDVDDTRPQRELGPEWFEKRPVEDFKDSRGRIQLGQRSMMGPKRFDAWKSGEFKFEDQAKITGNATWGDQATVKPLKELVAS